MDHGIFFIWGVLGYAKANKKGNFKRSSNAEIGVDPPIASWGIWWEGNAWMFEGRERSAHDLMFLFLESLFEWINASRLFSFAVLPVLLD